jgi:two-component system, OmpR family, alkaline phosphatase synthesis response regulator PhoP
MNENILLVEDEEALQMTLGDRLRSEGYVVDSATDGIEGFHKATQLPFDLLILDIMLPHRDGFDLCRDIRLAGLATPILILTARGQTAEKVVGLKLGADDYVTKPFDTLELMARIEALLRRAPTRPRLSSIWHNSREYSGYSGSARWQSCVSYSSRISIVALFYRAQWNYSLS